jgi:hypothetical protein
MNDELKTKAMAAQADGKAIRLAGVFVFTSSFIVHHSSFRE